MILAAASGGWTCGTGLVALSYRFLPQAAFYVCYALLLGVYFLSLVGLFDYLAGPRKSPTLRLAFIAILILLHSAAIRWAF